MILLFIALIVVSVWGVRFIPNALSMDELNCFAKEQSTALNGVSILLVYICHTWHLCLQPMGYESSNIFDSSFLFLKGHVKQLLVVTFLFYSGYGCVEQIKTKGSVYVDALPVKRILVTWLNFAVAVVLFALVHLLLGEDISCKTILAAFTGLRQIGNPSWYIVCILWGYVAIYLVSKLLVKSRFRHNRIVLGGGVLAFMLGYIVFAMIVKPGKTWWWDTALVIPFGVFVSLYKEQISDFIKRYYWLILSLSTLLFVVCYKLPISIRGTWYNVVSIFFMMSVLLITCRLRINNQALQWLGCHVFPIYMYHMLFFLIARCLYTGPLSQGGALFVVVASFALSVLTACYYHKWQITLKSFRK